MLECDDEVLRRDVFVVKELRRQGYSDSQLFGRSLIAELGRIVRAARDGLDQPPPKPEKRTRRLLSAEERSEAARRGAATRSRARQAAKAWDEGKSNQ